MREIKPKRSGGRHTPHSNDALLRNTFVYRGEMFKGKNEKKRKKMKIAYSEPADDDELTAIMRRGFEHMQAPHDGSPYLRLSPVRLPGLPAHRRRVKAGRIACWRPRGPVGVDYRIFPNAPTRTRRSRGGYRLRPPRPRVRTRPSSRRARYCRQLWRNRPTMCRMPACWS